MKRKIVLKKETFIVFDTSSIKDPDPSVIIKQSFKEFCKKNIKQNVLRVYIPEIAFGELHYRAFEQAEKN